MKHAQQLERRYYDPGTNPQPVRSYGPRSGPWWTRKRKAKKTLFDRARLYAAQEKRERKAARNLNALLLPGPRWEVNNGD